MRSPSTRLAAVLLIGCLGLVACGGMGSTATTTTARAGAPPGAFPAGAFAVRASSDIGLGAERLLVGIGDETGARLGSPQLAVDIEVHPESDPTAVQRTAGLWTWIVPEATGLYRATFDFDTPGIWIATVHPADGDPLESFPFQVQADPLAPALGEPAPAAPTPTLDDLPLDELTTDPEPDPRFYEVSLAEALAAGKETVLVFSTPAYCRTASCGPLLENVKQVAPDHPDVAFIHVEVFTGLQDPDFAPDAAHVAPAAGDEWYSLPSEPWVFVIDPSGTITARFEGVMDPVELETQLG